MSELTPGDTVRLKGSTRTLTVMGFRAGYTERVSRPIEHIIVGWFDDSVHSGNSWTQWEYLASELTLVLPIAIDPSLQGEQ